MPDFKTFRACKKRNETKKKQNLKDSVNEMKG
jgi:hypothetical protein